jgi:hypothetical protein
MLTGEHAPERMRALPAMLAGSAIAASTAVAAITAQRTASAAIAPETAVATVAAAAPWVEPWVRDCPRCTGIAAKPSISTGTAIAAVAAVATEKAPGSAIAAFTTQGAIAAVSAVAEASGSTTVAAVAAVAAEEARVAAVAAVAAEEARVAAVARCAAVPAGVAAIATVVAVAAIAAEYAAVTAIAHFLRAAGLTRVREAIADEEASIRLVRRAVAEKHIAAFGRRAPDALNRFTDPARSRGPRLGHRLDEWTRHVHRALDARRLARGGAYVDGCRGWRNRQGCPRQGGGSECGRQAAPARRRHRGILSVAVACPA